MSPQQTIAHYRITAKLGEGGMGEVWRATDTKLSREVAIKILPDAFAADPDRLARFTREAQVLASLNHPNIAAIYGVEEKALIMELVPGGTLEEKIASAPIPLEEALEIAAQIADALETAHEKGVIHRDLKPGNVKVTPEGVVKVLDFGLAKAMDGSAPVSNVSSPTLTLRATQMGMIMGTAEYMAPEQAAGKPVDRRADIWSFGVVLYEMLTGKRLFKGETVSHILASVLKDPISFEVPQVPAVILGLLARCLNRNAKERLRDIGEARIAIRGYLANPAAENEAKAGTKTAAAGAAWRWKAACAVLVVAVASEAAWSLRPTPPEPVTRFAFALGPDQALTSPNRSGLAMSPDGTQMVYAANGQLYLHTMFEFDARPLAGTNAGEGAGSPTFSPDGKSLVFYAQGRELRRIAVGGGAAVTLCSVGTILGVSWSDQGILFADNRGIMRISPNGGQPETLVAARAKEALADPVMLPGGETVLFAQDETGIRASTLFNSWWIVAQNLKTGARKTLVEGAAGGRYLPTGHLTYVMNGVLFAAPFNARRLEITGSPVGMVEGVQAAVGAGQFAYSNKGTLIYLQGPAGTGGQMVLARVGRKGEVEPLKVPAAAYGFPRVSRDGKRLVYQVDEGKESAISVWDWNGDTAPRRLTLPGTGVNRYPIWSADGERVAFQSDREGDLGIWWQRADGGGAAERLTRVEKDAADTPDSWSLDGRMFSFTHQTKQSSEVWTYSVQNRKATVFAAEPNMLFGRSVFSPDGHWVAYQWITPPASRVYVRAYPPTAAPYLAPQDGDTHHPVWSPDGKELFYIAGAGQTGSMSVFTKPAVSFGSPVRTLRAGFTTGPPGTVRTFDVLPDGGHFIGIVPAGQKQADQAGARIQVVLNWFDDLKLRVK
jgi:serine/threonine-protein kinase